MANKTLENYLKSQRKFSDLFFNSDKMSEEEKIERHKTFALALHSEIAELANAVHYKDHRPFKTLTQRQRILYETVDTIRYSLAMLNLWGFNATDFEDAFDSREAFLWDRETRGLQKWAGQPVIIFDVDDVIAQFRKGFFGWVQNKFGIEIDVENPNYYVKTPVDSMSNEEAYMLFISEGGIRNLETNQLVVDAMKKLRDQGFWVHLLTARPDDNLKCLYDTYFWLDQQKIPYDSVGLTTEKFRWLQDKEFYKKGALVAAIDDSPKHAAEYAQHGIKVLVPRRLYNKEVWNMENITTFDWWKDDLSEKIR